MRRATSVGAIGDESGRKGHETTLPEVKEQTMKKLLLQALLLALLISMTIATAHSLDEKMAAQVLEEINISRTEPRTYAEYVRQFRKRFIGKTYSLPNSLSRVVTKEGKAAVD